jgi:hypothetical protein
VIHALETVVEQQNDKPSDQTDPPLTNFNLLIYSIYTAGISLIIGLAVAELVPTRWSPGKVWLMVTSTFGVVSIGVAQPVLKTFTRHRAPGTNRNRGK